MTSTNFAAAQERVLARRQLQVAKVKTRIESQKPLLTAIPLSHVPFPLTKLCQWSLDAWNAIKGREGTRPAFRVGQIDAEQLDEELLGLLKGQVSEGLKLFGPHLLDDWSSEISLGLRVLLFKYTIWDHDASYGAALQNLRYTDARNRSPVLVTPTSRQKALYGLIAVGGRYAWTKWENWIAAQEGGYEEPNSRLRLLSQLSSIASTTHSIAAFASFLVFLLNGQYRTLLDRVLRIRLVPPTNQISREVNFEYLNRQLVWHAFTEFLLFLLPLMGISRWRRWLSRAWRKTKAFLLNSSLEDDENSSPKGKLRFLPERTCAICYKDQNPTSATENEVMAVMGTSGVIGSATTDITNPYETVPCACVYCFVCIATRLEGEEGQGWACLRCGQIVKECRPWAGDVVESVVSSVIKGQVSFEDGDKTPDNSHTELVGYPKNVEIDGPSPHCQE